MHGLVDTDLTDAGAPTNAQWTPIVLPDNPYDALLLYKVAGNTPTVYEHYIGGVKQDGSFLGGLDNSTTWGFQYYPADQGSSGMDYYTIRLIPSTGSLNANETAGFIKIAA